MSGRIVRDNIDGSITTVDDGVERTWNAEAWRLILPNEAVTTRRRGPCASTPTIPVTRLPHTSPLRRSRNSTAFSATG